MDWFTESLRLSKKDNTFKIWFFGSIFLFICSIGIYLKILELHDDLEIKETFKIKEVDND